MKNEKTDTPNSDRIEPARHEKLCAYLFGELSPQERVDFEIELGRDPALRAERARLEATIGLVKRAVPDEGLSADVRRELLASARRSRFRLLRGSRLVTVAAAFLALVGGAVALRAWVRNAGPFTHERSSDKVARVDAPAEKVGWGLTDSGASMQKDAEEPAAAPADGAQAEELRALQALGYGSGAEVAHAYTWRDPASSVQERLEALGVSHGDGSQRANSPEAMLQMAVVDGKTVELPQTVEPLAPGRSSFNGGSAGASRVSRGENGLTVFASKRAAQARSGEAQETLTPQAGADGFLGGVEPRRDGQYRGPGDSSTPGAPAGEPSFMNVELGQLRAMGYVSESKDELEDLGYGGDDATLRALDALGHGGEDEEIAGEKNERADRNPSAPAAPAGGDGQIALRDEVELARQREALEAQVAQRGTELLAWCQLRPDESPRDMFFRCWGDNPFVLTAEDRLSTFAADVDTASYALARSYLMNGMLPPEDAVRTEEFVNYFKADQPAPADGSPFRITLEAAPSPFAGGDPRAELLRITVRGRDVAGFERSPLALTLVIDNSGSMKEGGRLELVKESVLALLRELNGLDSVAVVVFSENARVLAERASAANRGPLEDAIYKLPIESGTNAEAGLVLGYELAARDLTANAVNRVVLFSDGVANIGETDQGRILELVQSHRARGIYLNTFGVGMGNHDDEFLEQLANQGDGLCNYLDTPEEGRKLLAEGLVKSFQPIARDVKIQVEFDPAQIEFWRQLGYENRVLRHEDFENDAIDAGEVNAGHQVSALYEVARIPRDGGPFATVRLRYKPPFAIDRGDQGARAKAEAETALEIRSEIHGSQVLPSFTAGSSGYRRSVLVAQFAEVLRDSVHARKDPLGRLLEEARQLERELSDPDFSELVGLLERANPLLDQREKEETPELQKLVDGLCQLHYERGQRERKRLDADSAEVEGHAELERQRRESETAELERMQRLEAEIRAVLRKMHGLPVPENEQVGQEELERLRGLGYVGDDRRRR